MYSAAYTNAFPSSVTHFNNICLFRRFTLCLSAETLKTLTLIECFGLQSSEDNAVLNMNKVFMYVFVYGEYNLFNGSVLDANSI